MMAEAEDLTELRTKHEHVTSFLSYAIQQERGDGFGMFNTILLGATPRAVVLVLHHIPWVSWSGQKSLVQVLAAMASAVQYTEEVARCVVGTILVIASHDELVQYLTVGLWWWLTARPTLHPFCVGRDWVSHWRVVNIRKNLADYATLCDANRGYDKLAGVMTSYPG